MLTGAAGSLGRRVVELLVADPDVGTVVAIDAVTFTAPPPAGVRYVTADLSSGDVKPLLEGADTVVHLAFAAGQAVEDEATVRANMESTRRVLEAAGDVGVTHIVLMSSATVYGAWPGNPVPLTEDASVRPNPGASYAVQKGEIERLGADWVAEHPGSTVAVLRPAVAVAGGEWSWLAQSLGLGAGIRAGDDDPPFQLLHLDDLASAVDVARRARLDGPYNVSPDGWVSGEEARALAGDLPRLRLPAPVVRAAAVLLWRWRVGRMPPGLLPYTMHPFVVANDRLKAAGWAPTRSNEETWVEATPGTPWSRLSPQRRQELALGAASVGGLGIVTAVATTLRRHLHRRA